MSGMEASHGSIPPRNRPPSLLACIACRGRHLKCNGQMPVCKRCHDSGTECNYQQSRRGYKGPRRTVKVTENEGSQASSNEDSGGDSRRTPTTATLADRTPTAIPGLDLNMNDDNFPISNYSDAAIRSYHSVSELYQTAESTSSMAPLLTMGNGQHSELAVSFENNALNQTARTLPEGPRQSPEALGDTLIDVYYANFHSAHPFIIPRELYKAKPYLLPPQLKAVMRFVGSHFMRGFAQEDLRSPAEGIAAENIPNDGYKVQGLVLLGMSLFARCEPEYALTIIDQAINLAVNLGMNSKTYASNYGMGNHVLEESWRRTWWELYNVDGILASMNNIPHTFRLQDFQNDLLLPSEETDYAQCKISRELRTQADFLDRTFSTEDFAYSSYAYKIEAVRLLGKVLNLGTDIFAATDEQVESLDTSLANFMISLPPDKRYVLERDGRCNEVLFSAHNLIDSALIMLHRPRSSLVFVQNHYPTPCTRQEAIGTPTSAYEVHTNKAIKAANSISKAIALRTPMSMHTPCFICATSLAATVHLPAYPMETSMDRASAIKERLQLTVNALSSMGEVWPMAKAAKGQISQFAREIFAGQAGAAGQMQAQAQIQEIDIESMMEDQTWLDELANLGPGGNAIISGGPDSESMSMSAVTMTSGVD